MSTSSQIDLLLNRRGIEKYLRTLIDHLSIPTKAEAKPLLLGPLIGAEK
jgi:hypothetical protein